MIDTEPVELPEELYMGRIHGWCRPCGLPEYDNISGYVVGTYSYQWRDRSGTLYRADCTVINLGRPDRGTPADPGAAMTPEELEVDARYASTIAFMRANKKERHAELIEQVRAYLTENAPRSVAAIARDLHVSTERVRRVLHDTPGTFAFVGGERNEWGLSGVVYHRKTVKRAPGRSAQRALELLNKRGPMSAQEIGRLVGVDPVSLTKTMLRYKDWFCVVGETQARRHAPATRIWGLVGKHETAKEEALAQ